MSAARPFFYLVIQLNITSHIKDLGVYLKIVVMNKSYLPLTLYLRPILKTGYTEVSGVIEGKKQNRSNH